MAVAPLPLIQEENTTRYSASEADMVKLWGELRSLMHAQHIDVATAAELLQEVLDAFPNHAREYASAYAMQMLRQRANQREVNNEIRAFTAPSLWSDDSDRMQDHVQPSDQIVGLDILEYLADEYEDEWALEHEEWYWEELSYYNIFEDYQGDHLTRDCLDLLGHYTSSAHIEVDDEGYVSRVFVRGNTSGSIWYEYEECFVFDDGELHPLTEYFPS